MASYAIQGKVLHVRQRLFRIPMVEVGIAVIAEAELRFGVGAQTRDIRDSKRRWRNSCCGSRFCDGIRQPRNITSLRHALERTGDPMGNLWT